MSAFVGVIRFVVRSSGQVGRVKRGKCEFLYRGCAMSGDCGTVVGRF